MISAFLLTLLACSPWSDSVLDSFSLLSSTSPPSLSPLDEAGGVSADSAAAALALQLLELKRDRSSVTIPELGRTLAGARRRSKGGT